MNEPSRTLSDASRIAGYLDELIMDYASYTDHKPGCIVL